MRGNLGNERETVRLLSMTSADEAALRIRHEVSD